MSLPTLNMINVNLQKISLIPITRHPSWHSVLLLQCLQDKKTSIGNWIQCREVLDTGVSCGKWRRYTLHSKWLLFLYFYVCAYTAMLTHNVIYVYAFFLLHGPLAGHHCLLFNQATGTVHVRLFGILSTLIVLFRR